MSTDVPTVSPELVGAAGAAAAAFAAAAAAGGLPLAESPFPLPPLMLPPPTEILTVAEAAAFLRVSEAAVLELADAGQLPARKIGNDWRFLKEAIVDWLRRPQPVSELKKKSMLSVIGVFKDDDTLEAMVEEIYRQRKQNPVGG